jgi:glycosyltransferase involved in cell wall biosynthesis
MNVMTQNEFKGSSDDQNAVEPMVPHFGERRLLVLHDSGAKSHYRALGNKYDIEYFEFSVLKLLIKALVRTDVKLALKQIRNLKFLFWELPCLRDVDVILGIAPFDWRLVFFYSLPRRESVAVTYHTSWCDWTGNSYPKRLFAGWMKPIWSKFLRNCSGIACVTEKSAKEIQQFLRASQERHSGRLDLPRIHIVGHSIPQTFVDVPLLNRKEDIGVFIGRWEPSKGSESIIELIASLDRIKMVIIGTDKLGRTPTVKGALTPGYISEIKELIAWLDKSKFLILPSVRSKRWQELFGLVIVEAMARGCIPVCTDHVGPKEIITFGVNGFYFPEANFVEDARNCIVELLEDESRRNRIAGEAVKRANEFSTARVLERWLVPLEHRL